MSDEGQLHQRSNHFAKIPSAVIHDKRLSDGAVRLYGHMHWRYGNNHMNFEGRESVAKYLGVSPTTISNRIKELEAYGWVVVVERDFNVKTGNYQTPFYHVFEVRKSAFAFRRSYKPKEGERVRPLPKLEARKSRAGVGGKPSHKEKDTPSTQVDPVHPVNSSLHGAVNSSSHDLESSYLDPKREEPPALTDSKKSTTPLTPNSAAPLPPPRPQFPVALYAGDTYADGKPIGNMEHDRAKFIGECNAIFYAWYDALAAVGRTPAMTLEDLWAKHRPAAVTMAKVRVNPADVTAYVTAAYTSTTDTFWQDKSLPLAAVANNLAAWKAKPKANASPTPAPVTLPPPAKALSAADMEEMKRLRQEVRHG